VMDKNYLDRKSERRDRYNKKYKGKATKSQKNFKSLRTDELNQQEAKEDIRDAGQREKV
jgi:hypothetical protein